MRPAHCRFKHIAFATFYAHAQPGEIPRTFGGHVDHPVERTGPVVGCAGACDHVDLQHVQIAGTEEIPEGEVQARALVVHAVDQLQRAHGAGAVEAARVDHLEAKARRGHVHAFQVAKTFVKITAGHFLDREQVHGLHRQWGLLLLVADALPHHFRISELHGVRGHLHVHRFVQTFHGNFFRCVAEVDHREGERWLVIHLKCELSVQVRHHAAGHVLHFHHRTDDRLAITRVVNGSLELELLGGHAAHKEKTSQNGVEAEVSQDGWRVGSSVSAKAI